VFSGALECSDARAKLITLETVENRAVTIVFIAEAIINAGNTAPRPRGI